MRISSSAFACRVAFTRTEAVFVPSGGSSGSEAKKKPPFGELFPRHSVGRPRSVPAAVASAPSGSSAAAPSATETLMLPA
ncbi:MAG: hypothetical protein KIS78_17585 [Labilithrix sp.]|nr:hypothetical protein [Labilithrix sp.]